MVHWPNGSIVRRRPGRIDRGVLPWRRLGPRDEQSDDPFCPRHVPPLQHDFVSVNYRHAPEHRFPAAAEDGYAATRGWPSTPPSSADARDRCWWQVEAPRQHRCGHCQLARDRDGPDIGGQLLLCPATDCSFDRPSYTENATGYF